MAIDHVTYENLQGDPRQQRHRAKGEFALVDIGDEGVDEGADTDGSRREAQKSKTTLPHSPSIANCIADSVSDAHPMGEHFVHINGTFASRACMVSQVDHIFLPLMPLR